MLVRNYPSPVACKLAWVNVGGCRLLDIVSKRHQCGCMALLSALLVIPDRFT